MASSARREIEVSCSAEYEDYTYTDTHDIWTLVSLTAPHHEEEKEEKVPIDIVAVIDRSGSMQGGKLELVKKTLEFVVSQLNEKDRLGLITYSSEITTDFRLMKMIKNTKKRASSKIQNIKAHGSTNLCEGLMSGLCEIISRTKGFKNDVASVLLFTDGLANSGITDCDRIVEAMKDPTRYCEVPPPMHRDNETQAAPHTEWLKNIFGTQGKPAKPSTPSTLPQPSTSAEDATTVYTFGFGSDHDARMLKAISDAGNGMYYLVENEENIGESFAHCLGGLASTVAQGIQMTVTAKQGVSIKGVHTTRSYEHIIPNKSIKINIGDLQAEESRDVVFELTVDSMGSEAPDIVFLEQRLIDVMVDYYNVNTGILETSEGGVDVKRCTTTTIHDDTTVNAVVEKEKRRVDVTKAIKEAGDCARKYDWSGAQAVLNGRIESLRKCQASAKKSKTYDEAIGGQYDSMIGDLEEYSSQTKNAAAWRDKGMSLEMNMGQGYGCQRSNNTAMKAFQSPMKTASTSAYTSY